MSMKTVGTKRRIGTYSTRAFAENTRDALEAWAHEAATGGEYEIRVIPSGEFIVVCTREPIVGLERLIMHPDPMSPEKAGGVRVAAQELLDAWDAYQSWREPDAPRPIPSGPWRQFTTAVRKLREAIEE